MIVSREIMSELSAKAKENPRLRQSFDLRNSTADKSQRMLNAMEPGTVLPVHKHHNSSETVVILSGRLRWLFYDENGRETETIMLDANGDVRCINVEKDRWHSLECLETGTVIFECKDGGYCPLEEDELMIEK